MLLDNNPERPDQKVSEKLIEYPETGEMDIVTGYFTIGALVWFAKHTNETISQYRFILGEIASKDYNQITAMDLLNSEKSIEKVLKLKQLSQEAVDFLKQNKVHFKTFEPNFCHAKIYLFKSKVDNAHSYYITGSSNLTETGIGLKSASNVELNIYDTGKTDLRYNELSKWFDDIFKNKALSKKTIKLENGKEKQVDFKTYLIDEISKIFYPYEPSDIYFKILSEMDLGIDIEIETTLKTSKIYEALYDFQKKGAASLVSMLEKNNGAILADAVGLGKTWTALAVIKYYQKKGFKIIVFCPKKLENNWKKWKKNFNSRFKQDNFDYFIRFHTDLEEELMRKKGEKEMSDIFFTDETPKLFVIDESHNLRNHKSKRYNFLLKNILGKNENAKILMLSATPINNTLLDVRNQLKLIPQITDIDSIFHTAQVKFKKWASAENPKTTDLMKELKEIVNIADKFIVANTRKMVEQEGFDFPKWQKPENYPVTPNCIENCKSCDELVDLLPKRFSAYMPAFYAEKTSEKESQRDLSLVKMMHFLLLKRLESSWFSFYKTVKNIFEYHEVVLENISNYQDFESQCFDDEEIEDLDFEIGKKRQIKIAEIKNIDAFKNDLTEDIKILKDIVGKLEKFTEERDEKLSKLLEIIKNKQKVLIFTTYKDTAEYLHKHISKKIGGVALVSGETKDIENILQRFAPLAKFEESEKTVECEQKRDAALKESIKILIATDILSEGQNLQDCDFVINYDIHWNPVRVIQRMGRIDRIGSKHKIIHCANFWPTKSINDYLNLQSKIEIKMMAMKITGSEIPREFTEKPKVVDDDKTLERRQMERYLELMQGEGIDEIESKSFGLNNLTLASFKQDLTLESVKKYKSMPSGIFSGFKAGQKGLIALLRHKKDKEQRLIFVNEQGKEILLNQGEILQFLKSNIDAARYVPEPIENCDKREIEKYSNAIETWLKNSIEPAEKKKEDDLQKGLLSLSSINANTETEKQKFESTNWNLVCWEVISYGA